MDKPKILVWLVVGIAMVLVPMLYELITFIPRLDTMTSFGIILMNLFFAGAFLLLFARSSKFKLSDLNMYVIVFLFLVAVPLLFAWIIISPMVSMSMLLIYLLMHLVFTGGVLTLYSQQSQIRKLL